MSLALQKLRYGLLATLISGIYVTAFAGTGFDYNANASATARCDHTIPLILDPTSKRVKVSYTEKAKNSNLASAIPTAVATVTEMTQHLSPQAIEGLNRITVAVFHCDPTEKSGLNQPNGYNTAQYDYLTLLAPTPICSNYQTKQKRGNASWDVYGATARYGSVTRNSDGQLICSGQSSDTELCGTSAICDADIASASIKHIDESPGENVLVHEYGHAIMNVGLYNGTPEEQARLKVIAAVYAHYLKGPKLCNGNTKKSWACSNEYEMWAEATETWFHASCRHDVNFGIATPDAIKKHLPKLYTVLEATYGKQSEITPILPAGDPHCLLKKNKAQKETTS